MELVCSGLQPKDSVKMFTFPMSFLGASGTVPFLTYTHTWLGNADIQSNQGDFDGAAITALEVTSESALNLGSDNFTFSCIMTFDAFNSTVNPIMSKWETTGSNKSWIFWYNNTSNKLIFEYSENGVSKTTFTATGIGALSTSTEYLFTVSRNGSDLRMFIDGVVDATVHNMSTDIMLVNVTPITFGAYLSSGTVTDPVNCTINYAKISSLATISTFTPQSTLENDNDTIYLNSLEGANGSTPTLNTE